MATETTTDTKPTISAERLAAVRKLVADRASGVQLTIDDSIELLLQSVNRDPAPDAEKIKREIISLGELREAHQQLLRIGEVLNSSEELGYLVPNVIFSVPDGTVNGVAMEIVGNLLSYTISSERLQAIRSLVAGRAEELRESTEESLERLIENSFDESGVIGAIGLQIDIRELGERREVVKQLIRIGEVLDSSNELGYLVPNVALSVYGGTTTNGISMEIVGELLR